MRIRARWGGGTEPFRGSFRAVGEDASVGTPAVPCTQEVAELPQRGILRSRRIRVNERDHKFGSRYSRGVRHRQNKFRLVRGFWVRCQIESRRTKVTAIYAASSNSFPAWHSRPFES